MYKPTKPTLLSALVLNTDTNSEPLFEKNFVKAANTRVILVETYVMNVCSFT